MVLKRRIDQGFNGNHSPAIPRAPRSVRRRVLHKKDLESSQICAFELLAAVAGKLLEESECSSASCSAAMGLNQCAIGIKQEPQDVDKPLPTEPDEHGSSEESVFFSGLQKEICKEKPEIANEAIRQHSSPIVTSACSDRVDSNLKPVLQKKEDEFVKLPSETEGGSPNSGESHDSNIETGLDKKEEIKGGVFRAYATANKFSPRDQLGFGEKFLSSNVEVSLGRDSVPDPFLRHRKNVEVRNRDDDGIHFHCSQYSSKMKTYRSKTRIGDQRIRKLLTSKYWKVVPKLKDCEHSNVGSVGKHIYHKRSFNPIERSQCNTPFKKRKLFDRSSVVTYDRGISCESVSNSLDKSVAENKNGSSGKLQEGSGVSSSSTGCQNSLGSRNSNVGFSIKSFNVPELFVEVPETATVGSLKRTVLEAVTAVLNDGLRVGVLVHGKKIRDDNKTLFQSGISESNDLNSLGFTLEPNSPTPTSPPVLSENTSLSPGPDSPKCVNRSKAAPKEDKFLLETPDKAPTTASNEHPSQSLDPASNDHPSKSHDLVPTPTIEPENKTSSDSKALVPLPEANMEALAVVPVNQRSRRPEIGQRRTRRPFSVAEVEALVRAVEKLGTGRWRDVKLCAFENAKHRTYVDLKDKWKTLVHTARISPQQRRGEPVPQELLDRVLVAQAFWSDHQAKQHGKPTPPLLPPPLPGIPDSPAKRAGN